MIDNHIYFGNELKIKEVTWKRCMDLNDRQLRKVNTGLSGEKRLVPREDGFDITVASEIMAIVCLSKDNQDLKKRIGNITIGYNEEGNPVFAKDLKAEGAMATLLKDAINPNLVQTLEHTPALIHGGPFANIAHGCNSVRATKLALKLGDYVITEAGFGSDLGAEKFMDIKCRKAELVPSAVVCVATLKALKYHGGVPKDEVQKQNIEALKIGMKNLYTHIENMKNVYGVNVIVGLNKFNTDSEKEIEYIKSEVEKRGYVFSEIDGWAKGGDGAIDIANKLVEITSNSQNLGLKYAYELNDSIEEKISKVAKKIYRAKDVEYSEQAIKNIEKIKKLGYEKLPICIAKTQYSLSDDPNNLTCDNDYNIHVRDVILKSGSGFIVVLAGKIMTMPGLPKVPAAEKIDIDENGNITGIF